MNPPFFSAQIAAALGWTLVHSLWQIATIWLVFKLISLLFHNRNQFVYGCALMAMGASAIWSVVTFSTCYSLAGPAFSTAYQPVEILLTPQDIVGMPLPSPPQELSLVVFWEIWVDRNAAYIGGFWFLIAAFLSLRMAGGWWLAQKLRSRHVVVPDTLFRATCETWCNRLKIKRVVSLFESPYIHEPLTIGFWKPVVLFPLGMLTQLSERQVEVLLLHELAHIRRFDYLINIFQLLLEVIFFFHPLFRMLSSEARTRREYACDDLVVRLTATPMLYAKTLTDLQTDLVHFQNAFVMKSIGKNQFTTRILRIIGVTPEKANPFNWWLILLLPLLLLVLPSSSKVQATTAEPLTNNLSNASFADVQPQVSNAAHFKIKKIAKPVTGQPAKMEVESNEYDSLPPSVVAIVPEKMNVLYIGVDNPVTIAVAGYQCSDLIVKPADNSKGITISKLSDCRYNVVVTIPGQVEIQVYILENGTEKRIGSNIFRVKRIPDPVASMGGMRNQMITVETLLERDGIKAMLQNFDFDGACEVERYEVTILKKGEDPSHKIRINGALFPESLKKMFATMSENGGQIFIDNIFVRCPGDNNARNLGALSFVILPKAN